MQREFKVGDKVKIYGKRTNIWEQVIEFEIYPETIEIHEETKTTVWAKWLSFSKKTGKGLGIARYKFIKHVEE